MSFKDTDEDRKKSSGPHPDWKMNKAILETSLKKDRNILWVEKKEICVRYVCVNPHSHDLDKIYTHAEFRFRKNDNLHAYPLSFHMTLEEFKKILLNMKLENASNSYFNTPKMLYD